VRSVDVHVRRLRTKLGAQHQSMIDTVRGVGYMSATLPRPERLVTESTPSPTLAMPNPGSDRCRVDATPIRIPLPHSG